MEATHQALLLPFVLLEPHDLALLLLLPLPGLLRVLLHLPDQLDLESRVRHKNLTIFENYVGWESENYTRQPLNLKPVL